jgi:hypothetical protein
VGKVKTKRGQRQGIAEEGGHIPSVGEAKVKGGQQQGIAEKAVTYLLAATSGATAGLRVR